MPRQYRLVLRAPNFPLSLSASGRYPITASGLPFRVRGDAAYSLIAQLSGASLTQYLDAMQALGVNALIVSLYEKYFSSNAPANALGVAPFSTPNDIRTASTSYYTHVLTVIRAAAARGMVVFLEFFYSGYGAGVEGWYASAVAPRTSGECFTFGAFIGTQLIAEPNIVWVQGGDYTSPSQTLINAMMNGILSVGPASTLCTYHTDPVSDSRQVSGLTNLSVNWAYVYTDTGAPSNSSGAPGFLFARATNPAMAFFNGEPRYEGYASSAQWIREQDWGDLLGGGFGSVLGAEPRWHFDAPTGFITTGWVASLNSAMTQCYPYLGRLIDNESIRWWDLIPDTGTSLISSARGTPGTAGYITASKTNDGVDGTTALLYVSAAGARTIVHTAMPRAFTARWYDPTNGTFTVQSGSQPFANTGTSSMSPPAANSTGDHDFVLVLRTI